MCFILKILYICAVDLNIIEKHSSLGTKERTYALYA